MRIPVIIFLSILLAKRINKKTIEAMKPIEGRYILCSKITSVIGIIVDSIERKMKNHKTPNEINVYLFKKNKARIIKVPMMQKGRKVWNSKKLLDKG